ncbi:hypothetical protein [Bacillus benzoevorans]|uniref:Uncharacterized protein n=1 Tax=Bacillus benzoevorans TaxID=1456 RepID=A0A7X0HXF9_9BACI|nr:hypothetical protein [Bacillus benzoevorans]MBB6447380.1 hypothetical protein [Bacillus benzoevorans]
MNNVISLGAERIKRITPDEWIAVFKQAQKDVAKHELELKRQLINSDMKAINEPSKWKYLFAGIFMDEGETDPIYVWADSSDEAMQYAAEYDLWICAKVVNIEGNLEGW